MSLSDLIVAVAVEIFPEGLEKLRGTFKTVHYHPDGDLPTDVASTVQLLLTTNKGLPPKFKSVQELPHLKHVQMISAGADKALASDRASAYAANPAVTLSTASGIHVLSIPNYVVAMVINIFNQIPRQIEISRVRGCVLRPQGWARLGSNVLSKRRGGSTPNMSTRAARPCSSTA